jgi:5'-methylthioadenosine phosphorylase
VNYRANLWGLRELGVERIIATNAVGAIDDELQPGSIVVPLDIIDLTKSRRNTFYEGSPVTHVDVSSPYCPTIVKTLSDSAAGNGRKGKEGIVMACTEGPRYETPAEIRMLRTLGGGIVGMTAAPEVFLARELEMCYGSICFVSNMAAGLQRTLSAQEVEERGRDSGQILNKIIIEAVEKMPESRKGCACGRALSSAQLSKEGMEKSEGEDAAR